MREHSTKFTEAHFDAKASRYQTAIRSAPQARSLEVLPFILALNTFLQSDSKSLRVADLLCGSGYLTSAIKSCFKVIFGLDVSKKMLGYYPIAENVIRMKAALDDQSNILTDELKPDIIVALAGLHHVYEMVDGKVDNELSDILQQSLVKDWLSSLPEEGIMVIADITDPFEKVDYSDSRGYYSAHSSTLSKRYIDLVGHLESFTNSSWGSLKKYPSRVENYIDNILGIAPENSIAQPGLWFREVVAKYGLYGHVDHFLYPKRMVSYLKDQGYHAEYCEFPTPWIFPSMESFVFFFHEKFVLGPQVDSTNKIPQDLQSFIVERAKEYLGVRKLDCGAISVGWRLGFYFISKSPLISLYEAKK